MNSLKTSYNLVMITTFVNSECIYELIDSIKKSNNKSFSVLVILVSQGLELSLDLKNSDASNLHFEIVNTGKRTALSIARNIGLDYLVEHSIRGDFITFPDDDSAFDSNFFKHFTNAIKPGRNYLIPVFDTGTKNFYKDFKLKNQSKLKLKDFKYSGPPNMIMSYDIVERNIRFDTDLGVGAKFGSAEDNDFYFRCYTVYPFYFTDDIYIFHRAKENRFSQMSLKEIIKRFRGYSTGYIYVVLKYKQPIELVRILVRTIGATIVSIFRGNWKLAYAYFAQFFIRLKLIFEIWYKKEYRKSL